MADSNTVLTVGQFDDSPPLTGDESATPISVTQFSPTIDSTSTDIASQADEAITSGDVKQSADFTLPPPQPAIATAGLSGAIQEEVDTFASDQEKKAQEAEKAKTESQEDLIAKMLSGEGEIEATAKEFARRGGVDDTQEELDDINAQIRQEQHALRRQTESIEDEAGLTRSQKVSQIREVSRHSLRTQADLSVIQMAIQGRYDSAKAIADRAVAVKLEQQRTELSVLDLIYQDNKDMFTTAEQRSFETAQAERTRKLNKIEADETAKYNLAIEAQKNGAPTSVVSSMLASGSKEDALAVGGSYIGLLDRQAAARGNRMELLELALAGDQSAIEELGYDPSNTPAKQIETIQKYENAWSKSEQDINAIDNMIGNVEGFKAAVGSTILDRLPFTVGVSDTGVTPTVGIKPRFGAKADFNAGVKYLAANLTLEAIQNMTVPLTPISDADMRKVGESADEFLNMVTFKENGNVDFIAGSEERGWELLTDIYVRYHRVQDELNATQGLTDEELLELYNQNNYAL